MNKNCQRKVPKIFHLHRKHWEILTSSCVLKEEMSCEMEGITKDKRSNCEKLDENCMSVFWVSSVFIKCKKERVWNCSPHFGAYSHLPTSPNFFTSSCFLWSCLIFHLVRDYIQVLKTCHGTGRAQWPDVFTVSFPLLICQYLLHLNF